MRLYKYIAPQLADLLASRRIRFTQPIYFNDPFELAPCIEAAMDASYEDLLVRQVLDGLAQDPMAGAEHYRAALAEQERVTGLPLADLFPFEEQLASIAPAIPEMMRSLLRPASAEIGRTFYSQLRDRISRSFGILSLSEVPDNLLMWAHYASEHRGIVVGFDSMHPFFNRRLHAQDIARQVRRVVYTPSRPKRPIMYDPGESEYLFTEAFERDFFLAKSLDWAYEREWRMILPSSEASQVIRKETQEVLLYDFPADAVIEVILGCRASCETEEEVRRHISDPVYSHVAIRKAQLHSEEFRLTLEPAIANAG
jgi:hypothetical protein